MLVTQREELVWDSDLSQHPSQSGLCLVEMGWDAMRSG